MNNFYPTAKTAVISLANHKGESRVDSRVIARHLHVQHKSVLALVDRYKSDFEELGLLPFQTRARPRGKHGGGDSRYALLNEDQAYLSLTYSRNTAKVRRLKINLVKAFRDARADRFIEEDYLPFYHQLHDSVKLLAEAAHDAGSQAPERVFHMNFNKLLNTAFGITSGRQVRLSPAVRAKITVATMLVDSSIRQGLQNGLNHKEIYQLAKDHVTAFAHTVSDLMLEGEFVGDVLIVKVDRGSAK